MGKLTGKGKHTVKEGHHPYTNMISKPAIMRRGEYKCRKWELNLKLRDQQLKTIMYIYIDCFIKISWEMQTKKLQYIQTQKRKSNLNTALKMIIKPQEKRTQEEGKKKQLQKQPQTNKKMAKGTYTLIITLKLSGLMLQPKDIDWLNGYENKTNKYAVYKRTTSVLGTHTDWKWGAGKWYSM